MNYLTEAGISLIFLLPDWATTSTVQCWVSDMPDKCSTNWSKSLGCYVWDRVWSSLCRPWWPQRSSYLWLLSASIKGVYHCIFKLYILKYKSQTKYHPVIGCGFDLTPQRKKIQMYKSSGYSKKFLLQRGSNQGFFTLGKAMPYYIHFASFQTASVP